MTNKDRRRCCRAQLNILTDRWTLSDGNTDEDINCLEIVDHKKSDKYKIWQKMYLNAIQFMKVVKDEKWRFFFKDSPDDSKFSVSLKNGFKWDSIKKISKGSWGISWATNEIIYKSKIVNSYIVS